MTVPQAKDLDPVNGRPSRIQKSASVFEPLIRKSLINHVAEMDVFGRKRAQNEQNRTTSQKRKHLPAESKRERNLRVLSILATLQTLCMRISLSLSVQISLLARDPREKIKPNRGNRSSSALPFSCLNVDRDPPISVAYTK